MQGVDTRQHSRFEHVIKPWLTCYQMWNSLMIHCNNVCVDIWMHEELVKTSRISIFQEDFRLFESVVLISLQVSVKKFRRISESIVYHVISATLLRGATLATQNNPEMWLIIFVWLLGQFVFWVITFLVQRNICFYWNQKKFYMNC